MTVDFEDKIDTESLCSYEHMKKTPGVYRYSHSTDSIFVSFGHGTILYYASDKSLVKACEGTWAKSQFYKLNKTAIIKI